MSNQKKKLYLRIMASLLAFGGVVLLTMVFYPLLSYKLTANRKFPTLLSPVDSITTTNTGEVDYTKASNWFVGDTSAKFDESNISYYTMSVPKLGIKSASVAIGGEDLTKYLIQYPGTALPGKRGNVAIFGHSTLPSFYDPEEYISIFSTLSQLDTGDDIKLYYDGIEYTYRVENLIEVSPTDIQILEQNVSDSFLSLITCTPPGDPRKPRRLIVRARIVPLGENRNENNWD
ncbi:hypothetical protein A2188_00825 [Candidatus Woesebacteria bacterium RIFOXYA1_FULL_43_9]|uniref:Sortase n=1 Tax=Candidatus Woesebacteria bacterium RIFOXYA1_FULL_43_9 TaxID=1802534 RepID=A0A1F8CL98_9BACT|nr:MAG: hypothetical protein A2188_00825 [Candidatus Woesebacteria bacterium RIFOXYA1_FULL_43_9]